MYKVKGVNSVHYQNCWIKVKFKGYVECDQKSYMKLLLLSYILPSYIFKISSIVKVNKIPKSNRLDNDSFLKKLLNISIVKLKVPDQLMNLSFDKKYISRYDRYDGVHTSGNLCKDDVYIEDKLRRESYIVQTHDVMNIIIDKILVYSTYIPSFIKIDLIKDSFNDINICFDTNESK